MSTDTAPRGTLPPPSFTCGPSTPAPFETVTAAFHHHVQTSPHTMAARDLSGGKAHLREVTYADLARRVGRLSRRLVASGVQPGDRVPLVVKRGIEMLVGIVSILSCGAQYVPLDGGVVPDSTLAYVLRQVGCRVVLCLRSTEHRLRKVGADTNVVVLDQNEEGVEEGKCQGIDLARPDSGCYIIYTSGTTGIPKGVDVSHRNVTNLVCQSPGNLGIRTGTRVGHVLNISFDMAAWEILGSLCNGGTLVIRGSDWKEAIREIDVLICTPSILAQYNPAHFTNIKTAATAGEPSSQRLADRWASQGQYFNCCGPTETTIVNTIHEHIPGAPLSIGRPTPNNKVYILNGEGNPVRVGDVGIMWAGGCGVSRGYVGQPELTRGRYQVDKFSNGGAMMYNTGDLGRWREDGLIDILGRVDDQIKVKGFRVELDGVAACLGSCPGVARASALLINGEIHGFVAPKDIDEAAVRQHLQMQQPYYAIPNHLHLLEALPSTENGKVDKRALRVLVEGNEGNDLASSVSDAEMGVSVSSFSTAASTSTPSPNDKSSLSTASSFMESDEKLDLTKEIPEKYVDQPFRGLKHRILIVYRRLFTLVGLGNLAALVAVFVSGANKEVLGTITAVNLVIAVLVRQDFVINLLYTITCSVPKSFPLAIRTRCAKIYHLGGAHSGAAFCAGAWLLAMNINDAACRVVSCPSWEGRSIAAKALSWILSVLFMVMFASAWPTFRKTHHDLFERMHRFVGWTMLALFWAQTIVSVNDSKDEDIPLGQACAKTPSFWLLMVASASIATSWLFLRKVPVEAEVLSDHAVRLHFGYAVPVNGTFARLSFRPLLEWHSFATIPAPTAKNGRPKGYSLVVSNAGDWTKSCIQKAPTQIWVRGVATCGVMRIATLFNRIVIIATGSGIGPLLGHIQDPICETQLIWSASKPERTFGAAMIETIKAKIPNAVIHDTKTQGRPDLVKMGYNLAKSFNAEAVIIIANEKVTKKVVYGLETRGVAAYGAIWDS